MSNEQNKTADLLKITSSEQYHTAEDLISKSRASTTYFVLLAISTVIIAAGLLLDNAPVVVGGMLVAPVLTPLLAISLGLALGETKLIQNTAILLLKSMAIVISASFVMAIIIGTTQTTFDLENSTRVAVLYFIIAIASGIGATFAWVRKELTATLPGIAIAVSLVPPLSLIGIWLSEFNFDAARFYFYIFFLNLLGIIMGSLIIFLLLKFYKSQDRIHKKVELVSANKPINDH